MVEHGRPAPIQLGVGLCGPGERLPDHACERGHAEAVADAAERLAAGERISGFVIGHDAHQLINRNSLELNSTLMYRPHAVASYFTGGGAAGPRPPRPPGPPGNMPP